MSEAAGRQAGEVLATEEIRSHFPALERVHNGERVAYFDGPGGTQVPRRVVEAMSLLGRKNLRRRLSRRFAHCASSTESDQPIPIETISTRCRVRNCT